jgi:hypothetical protein
LSSCEKAFCTAAAEEGTVTLADRRLGLGLELLLWFREARVADFKLLLLTRGVTRTGDGSREERVELAADADTLPGGEILGAGDMANDRLGAPVSPSAPMPPDAPEELPRCFAAVVLGVADDPLGDADGRSEVEAMAESDEKASKQSHDKAQSTHPEGKAGRMPEVEVDSFNVPDLHRFFFLFLWLSLLFC